MADDDIWASDEDNDQVSYDQMIAQREWEKMNEVHGNVSKRSLFSFTFGGWLPTTVRFRNVIRLCLTIQFNFCRRDTKMVLLRARTSPYKKGSTRATKKVLRWAANLASFAVLQGKNLLFSAVVIFADLRTHHFHSTLLVYYTQVQKDVLDSTLLDQLTQLYNELSAIGVEDLYTKDYFREPVNEEEKKDDQCCGQGSCSSSEPAKDDQCCGQGSCSSSEPAKEDQTSAGCCKSQDSESSCRSNDAASKSVDPAAVVASYQKRVDQLVSQLPLSLSNIVV